MPACGPDADIWGEDDNARLYDAFARQHPIYRDTSRDLIALARLPADAAVLDLACGTGITSREILAALGPGGTVTGADTSAAMLGVAARAITDPRITWIQAPAEIIDRHVTGLVDAVVCNSAIWQTDLPTTAAAVRSLLAAGGRFVFNTGAGYLGQQRDPNFTDDRPSPVTIMRDIAARDHGWRPPDQAARPSGRTRPTRESIRHSLDSAGFDVEEIAEFAYQRDAGAHPGMPGSFVHMDFKDPLDPELVYIDTMAGDLFLEADADLRRYRSMFDHLRATALSAAQTSDLLASTAATMKGG